MLNTVDGEVKAGIKGTSKAVHAIYIAVDKSGVVRYIGRTAREVTVRAAEHIAKGGAKAGLVYREIKEAGRMTLKEARIYEQKLINSYGGPGKQLLNEINSVAEKFWDRLGIK